MQTIVSATVREAMYTHVVYGVLKRNYRRGWDVR